jgi:DnaJ family protein C protein 19
MIKLIYLAVLLSLLARFFWGQWPWQIWQRLRGDAPVDRARHLLGLSRFATRQEIIAAHKRLIVQVHPDRGGDARLVHEANAARDLLLAALAPAEGPRL